MEGEIGQQVNSLRQELQLLASNRPVTIVTSSSSGGSRYGVIVVLVVVGYGYVWWKGWKLPDMMFATRRGLCDACNTIAKQLETVYSSIAATKRHLSSRIDRVDCSLDECAELTATTREEVSELRGDMKVIAVDVQSVHHAVQTLESKINRIEGKQDLTIDGVGRLIARTVDFCGTPESIQAVPSSSSRPALELPQMTPSSSTGSLPSVSLLELPYSPASDGSHKDKRSMQIAASASGLKGLHGISDVAEMLSSPEELNSNKYVVEVTKERENGNSSCGMFGGRLPNFSASLLTRTRSALQSLK
ncbi:hypothetical protein LguiA_032883 [Lonicera macranthoides]